MITGLVQFKLAPAVTHTGNGDIQEERAEVRYVKWAGLQVLYLPEKRPRGGVYLWESREAAERFFTEVWNDEMQERFGGRPTIT